MKKKNINFTIEKIYIFYSISYSLDRKQTNDQFIK